MSAAEKPNIIFIFADDLGYGDVQVYNPDSKIPTPAMNKIAEEGMIFTDAHTSSSVCTPSRYSLLTGRYCWRTSLKRGVLNGFGSALIDPHRTTVADLLKANGYNTACIGKWHLGLDLKTKSRPNDIDYDTPVKNSPLEYGFDYSYIISASLNMSPYAYIEGNKFTEAATEKIPRSPHQITIISGGPKAPSFDFEAVVDEFTDKTIAYIHSQKDSGKPFFIYHPMTSPHKPVIPPKNFIDRSKHGIYGAFVTQLDAAVHRIDQTLEELSMKENTLLLISSDNGSFMHRIPEHKADHIQDFKVPGYNIKNHQSNYIWRGTKADIYEAGHRVPFIIRWPKGIKASTKNNKLICLSDFTATCAEMLGVDTPQGAEDSFSFWPVLQNKEKKERPPLIHHSINGTFAIRKGDWKLIASSGSGGREKPRAEPWDGWQLYNLQNDPSETNNLYSSQPEKAKELKKDLKQILREDFPSSVKL